MRKAGDEGTTHKVSKEMPRKLEERAQTIVMSNCLETRQAELITVLYRLSKNDWWHRTTL